MTEKVKESSLNNNSISACIKIPLRPPFSKGEILEHGKREKGLMSAFNGFLFPSLEKRG
jgi:hypothetical protein